MAKKLMDTSASSRKKCWDRRGAHDSSKIKLISNFTCMLGVPKSATENASLQKEVEVACQPILDCVACIILGKCDLEKVPSDDANLPFLILQNPTLSQIRPSASLPLPCISSPVPASLLVSIHSYLLKLPIGCKP